MKWLVGAVLLVFGVVLLIAGVEGNAGALFSTFTGHQSGVGLPGTSSSSSSSSGGGNNLLPLLLGPSLFGQKLPAGTQVVAA